MTDCRLLCGSSCLYMTRLLKTCIIGCKVARVASSRIDMLAGLSKCDSLNTPPDFCAYAPPAPAMAAVSTPSAATIRQVLVMLPSTAAAEPSLVQPDIFHAPVVVDAVDHDGQPFELGDPAAAAALAADQRLCVKLDSPPLHSPVEPIAFVLVRLHRLMLDHPVDLGVAIAIVIADPATRVIFVEHRIRVVDQRAGQVERDGVV